MYIKSENGIEVKADIVFVEALKWIKNQALAIIEENLETLNKDMNPNQQFYMIRSRNEHF